MFHDLYRNRRVLVTGHTGFKGSWLCAWLTRLDADVCGIALPPETEYSHFALLNLPLRSELCDVRDRERMKAILADFSPEIIFHLAAQPLVLRSCRIPAETFETNVMGAVHLLDLCRELPSVRAVVVITSDKCYAFPDKNAGCQESDPMGGFDPYSASKGCTELAVSAFRSTFFPPAEYGKGHSLLLASARAGNVIGGGDFASDRLVPDLVRAAVSGRECLLRNPDAVRPWQFVLEPLGGYLALGARLYLGETEFAEAWNFGPDLSREISVREAASLLAREWPQLRFRPEPQEMTFHEAPVLCLDCSKANRRLHWHTLLSADEGFAMTAQWYRSFFQENRLLTDEQLSEYFCLAQERGASWTP